MVCDIHSMEFTGEYLFFFLCCSTEEALVLCSRKFKKNKVNALISRNLF
jgi:hypothetical protein